MEALWVYDRNGNGFIVSAPPPVELPKATGGGFPPVGLPKAAGGSPFVQCPGAAMGHGAGRSADSEPFSGRAGECYEAGWQPANSEPFSGRAAFSSSSNGHRGAEHGLRPTPSSPAVATTPSDRNQFEGSVRASISLDASVQSFMERARSFRAWQVCRRFFVDVIGQGHAASGTVWE